MRYGFTDREATLDYVVNEKEKIKDVRVHDSNAPDLARFLPRLLRSSPRWEPAVNMNGDKIPVRYTLKFKTIGARVLHSRTIKDLNTGEVRTVEDWEYGKF